MTFKLPRSILVLLSVLFAVGILGYAVELSLPTRTPLLSNTFTPFTQATSQKIGSYDVLGRSVDRRTAERLLQTEASQAELASENGAVAITEDLITLGRDAFYRETFGNEYFFTDVLGAIDGPINLNFERCTEC
jgi:hypothetical protein